MPLSVIGWRDGGRSGVSGAQDPESRMETGALGKTVLPETPPHPSSREGWGEITLDPFFLLPSTFTRGHPLADSSWKVRPEGICETEMQPAGVSSPCEE